jgi:hypothetical protein
MPKLNSTLIALRSVRISTRRLLLTTVIPLKNSIDLITRDGVGSKVQNLLIISVNSDFAQNDLIVLYCTIQNFVLAEYIEKS